MRSLHPNFICRWKVITLVFLPVFLFCHQVLATDALDISTGLKTLLLINNRPPGALVVGIIFDPDIVSSRADAESIKSNIDKGNGVPGGLSLSAQLISTADMKGLTVAKAAFLAKGLLPADYRLIGDAASASGILTISTDLACAESGHCVLGIVTAPRVEIYYNAAAAEASHISFSSAFLMLVKQI